MSILLRIAPPLGLCALLTLSACTQQSVNLRLASPPTAAECGAWASALTARAHAEVGWLPYCPGGSQVLLAALVDARQETDTARLSLLARQLGDLQTGEVFLRSLEVLGDKTASSGVRITAMLIVSALIGGDQVVAGTTTADMFTVTLPEGRCQLGQRPSGGFARGGEFPEAADVMAARALDRVRDDQTESVQMRRLAACVRTNVPWVPAVVDPIVFDLRYKCGRELEVRNRGSEDRVLTYVVRDAAGRVIDEARVRARAGGAWQVFRTDLDVTTGQLELLLNGTRVGAVEMTGVGCAVGAPLTA